MLKQDKSWVEAVAANKLESMFTVTFAVAVQLFTSVTVTL
jgi:hypothetical protein